MMGFFDKINNNKTAVTVKQRFNTMDCKMFSMEIAEENSTAFVLQCTSYHQHKHANSNNVF